MVEKLCQDQVVILTQKNLASVVVTAFNLFANLNLQAYVL